MVKKYCVGLTEEEQEQEELGTLVSKGRAAACKQTHARVLLLSDDNQADGAMKDEEIARALKAGTAAVERVRRPVRGGGGLGGPGAQGATAAPPEEAGWFGAGPPVSSTGAGSDGFGLLSTAGRTGQLDPANATDGLVEREIVDSIRAGTVRRTLKKRTKAPVLQRGRLWLKVCWCLPSQGSAEFVCAMEDVLEVYHCRSDAFAITRQGRSAVPMSRTRHGLNQD